ncbi:MAG: tetratricopeptide repeat protein [Elusimicrobiales bacterium]
MLTRILLCVCLCCAQAAAAVPADDEPPEKHTVWDRLMMAQSYRNMTHGVSLLDAGRYSEAASEFGRAVVENPSHPWPHLLLGAALYWSGQVDQALTEYSAALKLDPQNSDGWQLAGIAYAWKGDAPAALDAFGSAARYAPRRSDIQMNLGSIHMGMGDYDKALPYLRRAAEMEPRNPLYWFQLGTLHSRAGRDDEAASAFKNALDFYPDYQDAAMELAAIYERGGNTKEALPLYKRAVKLKPGDSVARLRYCLLLDKTGQRALAQEVIGRGFALMPNTGGGIALSIAYSGLTSKSRSSAGEGAQKPAAETSPGSPLDSLRRNMERVPLDQPVRVSVEMVYMPEHKPEKPAFSDSGSMGRALGAELNKPAALAARRDFSLPPASGPEERANQIKSITDELDKAVSGVPAGAQMSMAVSMTSAKTGGAGGGPAPEGAPEADNSKAVYNPRMVGNDMGLWVMGSGWLELVSEVRPSLASLPQSETDPARWSAAGLAHLILGEAGPALEKFSRAGELGAKETALMGSAVAWTIMGKEDEAAKCLKEALDLNPGNQTAQENLKWLSTPSNVAKN